MAGCQNQRIDWGIAIPLIIFCILSATISFCCDRIASRYSEKIRRARWEEFEGGCQGFTVKRKVNRSDSTEQDSDSANVSASSTENKKTNWNMCSVVVWLLDIRWLHGILLRFSLLSCKDEEIISCMSIQSNEGFLFSHWGIKVSLPEQLQYSICISVVHVDEPARRDGVLDRKCRQLPVLSAA